MNFRTILYEDAPEHTSLDNRAYRDIRKMIVQGVLKPGEQIVQETLAERLGVSRTPLRRAIAALAQEGFVSMSSRGVAYVSTFTRAELLSIWEIRAVLEGLVCRLAADRTKPQHVSYLRALITSAAEEITSNDWSAYREADREFHSYLAAVVNDQLLKRIIDSYHILSISMAQGLLRPPEETLPEHLEILDAIESGDGDHAEQAMIRHIRASIANLKARTEPGEPDSLPDLLPEGAQQALASLVLDVERTAFLAREEGGEAVVVGAVEPQRMLRVSCPVRSRLPLHASAAGKVLLARHGKADMKRLLDGQALPKLGPRTLTTRKRLLEVLDRVREAGYATEHDEQEPGLAGLAVPLIRAGRVVGALSVLTPAGADGQDHDELLQRLRESAASVSEWLG